MNKIRISFFLAAAALVLVISGAEAQTSIQRITLSLVGEYQTNAYIINGTNARSADAAWTNAHAKIRPFLVSTGNVIRALGEDLEGTNLPKTNWGGGELVREVNLATGAEGIFLRKNGLQTNVSSFFGGSFSNNFMAGLADAFPGLAYNMGASTNNILNSEYGSIPQTLLYHGSLSRPDPTDITNVTTNYTTTAGIYFISLNTTNIKFNLVGVGDGTATDVSGRVNGTPYHSLIDSEYLGTAGTFYLNIVTNIYDVTGVPPVYATGPMHGTFSVGAPSFSTIPGP